MTLSFEDFDELRKEVENIFIVNKCTSREALSVLSTILVLYLYKEGSGSKVIENFFQLMRNNFNKLNNKHLKDEERNEMD